MSATFSTFCRDAIIDAAVMPDSKAGGQLMVVSITTDTGDYISIHFKNESNFKAFCANHNFQLEDKRSEKH